MSRYSFHGQLTPRATDVLTLKARVARWTDRPREVLDRRLTSRIYRVKSRQSAEEGVDYGAQLAVIIEVPTGLLHVKESGF